MPNINKKGQQSFITGQFENLRVVSIFLFPLVTFLAFRAQNVLYFLPKEALEAWTLPFQIIVWSIIFFYYDIVLIVVASNRIVFLSLAIGTISSFVLNHYLTSRYSLAGSCIAIVASLVIMFIFLVFSLGKVGIKFPLYKSCEKPAVAAIGLTLVLHYVDSFPFMLILLSSVIGYSLLFIIIFLLDTDGF